MIREKQRSVSSGWGILFVLLAIDLVALFGIYLSVEADNPAGIITSIIVAVLAALLYARPVHRQPERGQGPAVVRRLQGDGQGRGASLGESALLEEAGLTPHPELRERQAEGQRQRGQPDRNRRRGRLARGRHRGSGLRGARLRELPARADGIGRPQPRHELYLRHPRRRSRVAARPHGSGRGTPEA